MKRKLFAIGLITTSFSVNAQVFYAGNDSKTFVFSKALMYGGGNWMIDSKTERTVENKGNIVIAGDYQKGTKTPNAAEDGQEFVNVYTASNNYGQVKLLGTTGSSNARMAVERPAISENYYGASAGISFPYKDDVSYIMKAFGLLESDFKGDCQINTKCADRYKATLTKWNNKYTHFDAVPTGEKFKPGDRYNINLREADMQAVMKDVISYKGTPDGTAYSSTVTERAIYGKTPSEFQSIAYNNWKNLRNPYNEQYKTYIGDYNETSISYGKNIFRFGNPYTSNLDLSAVEGENAWVQFLKNSGNFTIKEAHNKLFYGFAVQKVMPDFHYTWESKTGSTQGNSKYFTATYDGTRWTGSAEALLIKPFEEFQLNFARIPRTSPIIDLKVDFSDRHKTFEYVPSAKNDSGSVLVSSSFKANKSYSQAGLEKNVKLSNVQSSDFYQLEIVLSKDNRVQASPVFIVGANNYKESGTNANSLEKVFVYGVNGDTIAKQSKKQFNEFNINTYVGKPLGLGFNKLENGQTYQLRLSLYEGSIFNKVDALQNGVFYLVDNETQKATKVNPNEPITFVADDKVSDRFEFYWNELPKGTLSDNDVNVINNQSTFVYRDGKDSKLRFENISNTARVEVYNMAGTLVYIQDNVSTNKDYTLDLISEGVYVVKVVYQNGDIRTIKTVNN